MKKIAEHLIFQIYPICKINITCVKCFRRRRRRRPERFRSSSGRPGFAPEITFDGYEGDIELPKLGNGEFFGHFDELDGKHFLDVSGKEYVGQSWRIGFFDGNS